MLRKILDAPIFTMNSGHKELTWGWYWNCLSGFISCRSLTLRTGTTSEWALEVYSANPWTKSLWKPSLQFVSNPWMSLYYSVVYQLIPGAVFDTVLRLSGNSLRFCDGWFKITWFFNILHFYMCILSECCHCTDASTRWCCTSSSSCQRNGTSTWPTWRTCIPGLL